MRLHENHCQGTISASITDTATTITSSTFARLPVVAAPDILDLTLDPGEAGGAPETVRVTAHTASSTSITVTRGTIGTARAHAAGTVWRHGATTSDIPTDYATFYCDLDTSDSTGVNNQALVKAAIYDAFLNQQLTGQDVTVVFRGRGTAYVLPSSGATVVDSRIVNTLQGSSGRTWGSGYKAGIVTVSNVNLRFAQGLTVKAPASYKPNNSRLNALVCNLNCANDSTGVAFPRASSIRIDGAGILSGNAANLDTSAASGSKAFNVIDIRKADVATVESFGGNLRIIDCWGADNSTNEGFCVNANDVTRFTVRNVETYRTAGSVSTGISANSCGVVRYLDVYAHGFSTDATTGRGITSYDCASVIYINCVSQSNVGQGAGIEYPDTAVVRGCQFTGATDTTDENGVGLAIKANVGGIYSDGIFTIHGNDFSANATYGMTVQLASTFIATAGTTGTTCVLTTGGDANMVGRFIRVGENGPIVKVTAVSTNTLTVDTPHGGAAGDTVYLAGGLCTIKDNNLSGNTTGGINYATAVPATLASQWMCVDIDDNVWGGGTLEVSGAAVAQLVQTSVTATNSTDTFTKTSHGYSNGDRVWLSSISGFTNFSTSTDYFVVNKATNTFQLSSTVGGAARTIDTADGTCTVTRLAWGKSSNYAGEGAWITNAGAAVTVPVITSDELVYNPVGADAVFYLNTTGITWDGTAPVKLRGAGAQDADSTETTMEQTLMVGMPAAGTDVALRVPARSALRLKFTGTPPVVRSIVRE